MPRQNISDPATGLPIPGDWIVAEKQLPVITVFQDGDDEVKESDLPLIAEKMLARHNSGTAIRLTIGHIMPDITYPESSQPKVIGRWLPPYRIGTFDSRPVIYATPAWRAEFSAEVKGRPFRSPEFYHKRKLLTGCGLLSRDPALPLGTFDVADYYANREKPADTRTLAPLLGQINMAEKPPMPEAAEKPEAGSPAPGGQGTPEGHDAFLAHVQHLMGSDHPAGKAINYAMKCYEMAQAAVGGAPAAGSPTNTLVPGGKPPQEDQKNMADNLEMAALRAKNAALEAKLAVIEPTVAGLQKESRQSKLATVKSEMRLYGLTDAKLADLDNYSDGELKIFADTVRSCGTKKGPHGGADTVTVAGNRKLAGGGNASELPVDGKYVITEEHSNYALDYMRDNNLTGDNAFNVALEKTKDMIGR